jgi:hypothetical protein
MGVSLSQKIMLAMKRRRVLITTYMFFLVAILRTDIFLAVFVLTFVEKHRTFWET